MLRPRWGRGGACNFPYSTTDDNNPGSEYYRATEGAMLALRWAAPEAVTSGVFTEKSDVWSFGIVMVEIFSNGASPYEGLALEQVLAFVTSGKRHERPANCKQELFDEFIMPCWNDNPATRPTFEDLAKKLHAHSNSVFIGSTAPLSPEISYFLTTFSFIWGSMASHVFYSIRIP